MDRAPERQAVMKRAGSSVASTTALSTRLCLSAAEWDDLAGAGGGCGLHSFRWLSTLADGLEQDFIPLVLLERGATVGVAPVLVRRRGLRTINAVPFPYLGPLVRGEHVAATFDYLASMERLSLIGKSTYSVIAAGAATTLLEPSRDSVLPSGYHATGRARWVLDTTRDVEVLRASLSSSRRSALRRAAAAGIVVRAATREEIGGTLPLWMSRTFARQGHGSPYPPEVARMVADGFCDSRDARLAAAVDRDGSVLALMVTVGAMPTAAGWTVQRSSDPRSSDAVASLYWDSIVWASALGHAALDLGGESNPGVANYKRGWGASRFTYARVQRTSCAHRAAATAQGLVHRR